MGSWPSDRFLIGLLAAMCVLAAVVGSLITLVGLSVARLLS